MELEVNTPISAEAEVKRYVLTGDDVYVKRYTNENIPSWYRNLISDIIASDSTITDLGAAVDYLSGLPAGYNQHITELKAADTTINSRLESLVATTGNHTAAIASLGITKVDATSAAAIARDTVSAYFANGSAGAWFNTQISTYASDIHANAMNISTLSATLDGQAVRIDTVEEVNISQSTAISTLSTEVSNALIALTDLEEARDGSVVVFYYTSTASASGMTYGDYLVDTDSWDGTYYTVYRYENLTGGSSGTLSWYVNTGDTARTLSTGYRSQILAGTAQATADGKVKTWYQTTAPIGLTTSDVGDIWINTTSGNKMQIWSGTAWQDPTTAQGSQAYTWSANASKLITNPNGQITGWSFGDGSNTKSYFDIYADNFRIVNATTHTVPFSISGSDVVFNGKVNFTNVTNVPQLGSTPQEVVNAVNAGNTTTIDGGKITTGSITTDQIAAGSVKSTQLFSNRLVNISAYNPDGSINESAVTMDINLSNGSIYIK